MTSAINALRTYYVLDIVLTFYQLSFQWSIINDYSSHLHFINVRNEVSKNLNTKPQRHSLSLRNQLMLLSLCHQIMTSCMPLCDFYPRWYLFFSCLPAEFTVSLRLIPDISLSSCSFSFLKFYWVKCLILFFYVFRHIIFHSIVDISEPMKKTKMIKSFRTSVVFCLSRFP